MANFNLFNTQSKNLPACDTLNASRAASYAYTPKHQLAQLAVTGCLNSTFYASAQSQLDQVLKLVAELDSRFVANAALYARQKGHMKDMPALLLAALTAQRSALVPEVFGQVVDSGKMLRNFVQILRSGATGRRSLGSQPKRLVQNWLNSATERQLLQASIGNQPSLADVVKMVHPKPSEAWREAFFAWVIGKPVDAQALPALTRDLLAFRSGASDQVPEVPFQLLGNETLSKEQWAAQARNMGWHGLRINLNTLARHGAFEVPGCTEYVAVRLADPEAVAKARVYPYQLLAAYRMVGDDVPALIREALQDALELSLTNVPKLPGAVVVCPDVSGSMGSPLTGYRQGATTAVRCIDVAALITAAVLRKQPTARVMPFEWKVVDITLNPRDSVISNAEKLAGIFGGGTCCSAPLKKLADSKARVDTLIMVSDNESWIDARRQGASETMLQWERIKRINPQARLICIDLQPGWATPAADREDILNVGGFSDAVFDVIDQFTTGRYGPQHWVEAIERMG
ncbi:MULTISPECIES: TROVE domain-containing protein [Pseudomonas]|uniref:TROVE domain-containing protein n=1 Tax=Pseudomonas TaxID=286 RepID=UPI000876D91E|nr:MULTISPECIES: TROVE domain-containing protein [Pseudomonas]TFA81535.1 TROVE domain-containing protein [Pseudomonas sp. LAIL14HWK12:I2]SCZ27428.1 SS-A/Ro ribonucleoprotein [Pseudomonas sp. NFIX46]SDB06911.1 SS-A/Ro ribonucleoprotein [Pseudomonas putida]SFQ83615.1 SS-A/Ro ribonucleoprotein [Pseudomonas sp. NFIX49]